MKNTDDVPILKNLVLIGGGHSHIAVLRAFAMRPVAGVRLTLISPDSHTAYSGMLPGLIAGHYSYDEAHIDLVKLAGGAGARFIQAEVMGLDHETRTVTLKDRPAVLYDLVSINTGSSPPLSAVSGAETHALSVKPVKTFLETWRQIEDNLRESESCKTLAIVGAGAGGVELAMAIRHKLAGQQNVTVRLVEAGSDILPGFSGAARLRVLKNLSESGIEVTVGKPVRVVGENHLTLDDDVQVDADHTIWTTGASAQGWFAETGLALDDRGFLAIGRTLQSLNAENVFAVGDCATLVETPRPKAGVFAVRQGPVLADNLRRHLLRQPLKTYKPQRRFLTILAMGRQHAVATKGAFTVEGDWVWRWKTRIDTAFMEKFSSFPVMMGEVQSDRLPDLPEQIMHCAGCGSKLPASALTRALDRLGLSGRDGVGDDAAVFDPPAGRQLAVSVDHFPAIIDDPFVFGRIAANHALGDLYAAGASPLSALAIVTLPRASDRIAEDDLFLLLYGAKSVFDAEGVRLLGGHSSTGPQMALGFSVTGTLPPGEGRVKGGLQTGDDLILTKPLGTGVIFAGAMRGMSRGRWIEAAVNSMSRSVSPALDVLKSYGVTGLTDVTGFGLAGHLGEMLKASRLDADLDLAALPALEGALTLLSDGMESSLSAANEERLSALTALSGLPRDPLVKLLCDPQTAGGLLAGIPSDQSAACLSALKDAGMEEARIIGSVKALSADNPQLRFG